MVRFRAVTTSIRTRQIVLSKGCPLTKRALNLARLPPTSRAQQDEAQ